LANQEDRHMIIVMSMGATEEQATNVRDQLRSYNLTPHDNYGTQRVVIAVLGDVGPVRDVLMGKLSVMPGVESVTPITRPYKLTSRESHPDDTVIEVLGKRIGNGTLTIMAGPCSIEGRDMMIETARTVAAAGATVLRGGAFKPRTSPYSFQGLGVEGLQYLAEARKETGLPTITEVMEPGQVEVVARYSDILQVGTRNMQNYSLLTAVGKAGRPVMLKRGYGATIEEWLMAAEYIVSSGNPHVILCERGIRTFETYTRNTLDLTAVPLLHHLTHLPVIVDPSHATGKRWLVRPMALAAVAAGADGIMVEVHPDPDAARSDGEQSLTFDQFGDMAHALFKIHDEVRTLIKDPFAMTGPAAIDGASKH
jgi:3-deoxy-7-phosphoheptulonate synthase